MTTAELQRRRRALQAGFFALFVAAPGLDLLRFDLHETQLWVLGRRWTLGLAAGGTEAALGIVLRGMLPLLATAAVFLFVAWRWGRLYCGWLCPHFSMVELLNGLLHRACGRFSVWDRTPTPLGRRRPQRAYWPLFALACCTLGLLWAVTLLTYLLPPGEVWGGLLHGTLTPNQARFIAIAAAVFTAEFAFARHLFCRFGCAVGFFQSLAWMANPKAMVVAFRRQHAAQCRGCSTARAPQGDACEAACPMRLQPRRAKRWMFSCVQCGRCLRACADSHAARAMAPNLEWAIGVDALRETARR